MPRFAANLEFLFTEHPPVERVGAAAAAGFSAVEMQYPYGVSPQALREALACHRLTLIGINTPISRPEDSGCGAVPGRERDFAVRFDQALRHAVALGASAIHCMAGAVSPDRRPAAEKTFIANLSAAADQAAAHGLTLLIEPLNSRDRPDYFLTRVEQAADLIAKAGRPNIKIQFDCYHVQIMQGDLIRRFERHHALIGHVQIAAVPSRAEPDEGEVNYPAVFAALDAAGYAGWVGAEYRPRGRTADGLGWARPYGIAPREP